MPRARKMAEPRLADDHPLQPAIRHLRSIQRTYGPTPKEPNRRPSPDQQMLIDGIEVAITAFVRACSGLNPGDVMTHELAAHRVTSAPAVQPTGLARALALLTERVEALETRSDPVRVAEAFKRDVVAIGGPKPSALPKESLRTFAALTLSQSQMRALAGVVQSGQRGATTRSLAILLDLSTRTVQNILIELRGAKVVSTLEGRHRGEPLGSEMLAATGFKPLPTGAALRQHYLDTLPPSEAELLGSLYKQYPGDVAVSWLAEDMDLSERTVQNLVIKLRGRELIDRTTKGRVRAARYLFGESS